jgi:NitT/TauT family transport system permease protein
MTSLLLDRFGRLGRFLWSGWAGLAGLSLLAAVWQAGHEAYGDFILPAPLATLRVAAGLLAQPETLDIGLKTAGRAIAGFLLTSLAGGGLGLLAGYSAATMRLARPLLTVILGVPPIAWIVLAMIWFGSTDGTVVLTVVVASAPIVFATVAEGIATRDRSLDDMAKAFGANALQRLLTIGARQAADHFFHAMVIALGTAFKAAVMAELLANVDGIGNALAMARANLDVTLALAWILIAVGALIVFEYGVVHPLRAEIGRWREAARPWGVKR